MTTIINFGSFNSGIGWPDFRSTVLDHEISRNKCNEDLNQYIISKGLNPEKDSEEVEQATYDFQKNIQSQAEIYSANLLASQLDVISLQEVTD